MENCRFEKGFCIVSLTLKSVPKPNQCSTILNGWMFPKTATMVKYGVEEVLELSQSLAKAACKVKTYPNPLVKRVLTWESSVSVWLNTCLGIWHLQIQLWQRAVNWIAAHHGCRFPGELKMMTSSPFRPYLGWSLESTYEAEVGGWGGFWYLCRHACNLNNWSARHPPPPWAHHSHNK